MRSRTFTSGPFRSGPPALWWVPSASPGPARTPGWPAACRRLGTIWEPGYCIGRKWWNRGYATEALCAVRDYWFGPLKGKWLCSYHANENVASGAVLLKAGFTYHHDAVQRRYDGTEVPCRAYFLLRSQVELAGK